MTETTPPAERLTAVLRAAQYLSNLAPDQDPWGELARTMSTFFGFDLVFVVGAEAGAPRLLPHPFSRGIVVDEVVDLTREEVGSVLSTGFLGSQVLSSPACSLALLPLPRDRKTVGVVVVGRRGQEPFSREELEILLALSGLFGNVVARVETERELRDHRQRLEEIVRERTAELVDSKVQLAQESVERREAQQAAEQAHAELEQIFQTAAEGLWVINRDGTVRRVNGTLRRMLGLADARIEGRRCCDVAPCGDCGTPRCSAARIEEGADRIETEVERVSQGERRWQVVTSTPLRAVDGSLLGVVQSFRDVTLQRRHADALLAAKQAAEAANLAKSQFLANMSHELRTPMNAILGMAEAALEQELSPTVRDMLQTAKDSADTLLELLNEVLDFSRIESGKLELERVDLDLRGFLEKTLRPLEARAAQKGLRLVCDVTPDVPDRLVGDPLRLRQVLTNLVGNAIKFTDAGRVDVRAGVVERAGHQVVLELSVTDTGIGISPEDQERIFAPFVQADASMTRRYGGTGLGLAIATKLVELMGGRMWVESRVGKGSRFRFTARFGLPAERCDGALAAVPASAPCRVAVAPAAPRSLRVLLVEDTPANQKVATYVLTRRGHAVEVVEDGRQALEAVHRSAYDVVLMDVQMPVMDGFEATAAIRALDDPVKARVPIIAMTAHALKGDEERCLAAGMDAYVSKPVDGHELVRLVEQMGAGRAAEQSSESSEAASTPAGRRRPRP